MAALALAVGAYLVQTRLPNAKCFARLWALCKHRFKNPVATAPLAFKRCAEVVKHQGLRRALWSAAYNNSCFRAELRQEDPPNLNILLSGGKETNKDSLSNGE